MNPTTPAATLQPTRSAQARPAQRMEARPPLIQLVNLEKTYTTARGSSSPSFKRPESGDSDRARWWPSSASRARAKSTLLHILGALDAPTAGTVRCVSVNVAELSQRDAAAFRNREIGYVWQFHYLLPEFTALENVAMPLMARGLRKAEALLTAAKWLGEVGLEERGDHRPGELSGGEQQRVALARALVNNPRLLLADEPTGDLDAETAARVFGLIERLHATHGLTSILVTHNLDLAARCTRILKLEGGRLAAQDGS
jgi:lipoprotein-releasing system ATP-binding protein